LRYATRLVDVVGVLDPGNQGDAGRSEVTIVNNTFWIIAEIIIGIAFLGLLSAVVTVIMTRLLGKSSGANDILDERYARGELNRDEYMRMRRDIEFGTSASNGSDARPADGQEVGSAARSHREE